MVYPNSLWGGGTCACLLLSLHLRSHSGIVWSGGLLLRSPTLVSVFVGL